MVLLYYPLQVPNVFPMGSAVYNGESKSRGQFPRPRNFAVGRKTLNIANSAPISANRWERPRGRYSRCRSVAERRGRSLVHGWCTPGAQRIPTHDSVCAPYPPHFPRILPPPSSLPYTADRCNELRTGPGRRSRCIRAPSTLDLPLLAHEVRTTTHP